VEGKRLVKAKHLKRKKDDRIKRGKIQRFLCSRKVIYGWVVGCDYYLKSLIIDILQ
jgi:hypothetical protein